ncbi:enoyl-CoA hydratase [Niveibacterium sp. SC-1]|uniref:enoyl-CoA hydratase n=1 Tax=Niveibacterium sp. SC-1 TaxID=3135646 RepID=UPI00311D49E6
MTPLIQIENQGGVRILRLNRAEKRNALTHEMYEGLCQALDEAAADASVRALVFAGSETAFTAGNDIADFLSNPPQDDDAPVLRLLARLPRFHKPMIAAVCGPAVGIGTTLLLHCDLVVAADDARFALPFVNLGLCAEGGSSYLLARRIGDARAAEWLMLGDLMSAADAHSAGLVNRILTAADVLPQALRWAQQLSAKPPAALRATRALLRRTSRAEAEAAIKAEADVFRELLQSDEAKEAFAAFLEKRPADFGRFT